MPAMHPLPGQPLPEGWCYIEHPELGRSDNPVPRASLGAWGRSGWSECDGPDVIPSVAPDAEQAGQVTPAQPSATTRPSPHRATSTYAEQASTPKE